MIGGARYLAIYTKTGDKGTTSLFDGRRVKKYELRVETYGTFDELNAHISLCAKYVTSKANKEFLEKIQETMFCLCAELATEHIDKQVNFTRITKDDVKLLEEAMDKCLKELPEVHQFILLGKSTVASHLHIARTVARRAERLLIKLSEEVSVRKEIQQYVNRLSDFLYTMAREEDFRRCVAQLTKETITRYTNQANEQNNNYFSSFSLDYFNQLAKTVEATAKKENTSVTMSVVNKAGHHLFHYQMKDALLVSIDMAKKKAYTAIATLLPTHQLAELVQPAAPWYQLETLTNGEIVTFGGGVPIYNDTGDVIGGLGISGATVEQDIAIAEEALSKVKMR